MFADNHSRTTVPDAELVSSISIAGVIIGVTLTLPVFILAGEIMTGLGAAAGAAAMAVGGACLTLLALVTGYIGMKSRLTTFSIMRAPFGVMGAKILTFMWSLTLIGWFGLTVGFFGQAVDTVMREAASVELPARLYGFIGGVLMIVTVLYGFRAMDWLNRIAVPLLAVVLLWALTHLGQAMPLSELLQIEGRGDARIATFGAGVTAMIAALAAMASGMPELTRFARRRRDTILASLLSYPTFAVLLLAIAGAPAVYTGNPDFTANLIAVGLGLPALIIVIVATWTTNIANIYVGSLALARVFNKPPDWIVTLGIGSVGVAFALAGGADYFISFLVLIGALLPPIAGVYVAHFFIVGNVQEAATSPASIAAAFIAWACGAGVAMLTSFKDVVLTTVPAVDSLLTAGVIYAVLKSFLQMRAKDAVSPTA